MMKHSGLYLSGFILLLPVIGCSGLSRADYTIKVGETINIELESNWSTGYQWHLINSDDLTLVSKTDFIYGADENEDEDEICGAPGVEIWSFTGNSPGKETLNFYYMRAGENKRPEERKKIIITVK